MTGRDRLVLMGLTVLAVLAAGWLLVVTPERNQAAQLESQVSAARQQLQSAEAQASSARAAKVGYQKAYASVVSLGKAVPAEQEVPSLIYELDQATAQRHVDFSSISSAGSGTSTGSTAGTATTASSSSVFSSLPFTFVFDGSFQGLYHLLNQIDGFATSDSAGQVRVNGRLLTIQGADISLGTTGAEQQGELSATITATAYVLPASQGLTAGATSAAPSGAGASATGASAPTAAAVVGAQP